MKGDKIEIRFATGAGETHLSSVTASKAGRTVRQRWSGKWVYVEEMTRTHKVVGGSLRVLASAVLVVADVQAEPPPVPATVKGIRDEIKRRAKAGQYESELDQPGHVPGEFTSAGGTA